MTKDPQRTKMVAPSKKAYIRAIRPVRIAPSQTLRENEVAEVTEAQAREFADKKFDNAYPYSGERQTAAHDAQKGVIQRAVRITEEEYQASKKAAVVEDDETLST